MCSTNKFIDYPETLVRASISFKLIAVNPSNHTLITHSSGHKPIASFNKYRKETGADPGKEILSEVTWLGHTALFCASTATSLHPEQDARC
jgi:hypothetical protein